MAVVYVQVLRALLRHLPSDAAVASFMVDFEAALWVALKKTFPDATVKGCVFHMCQAIWRHAQALQGLQRAYMERKAVHQFLR